MNLTLRHYGSCLYNPDLVDPIKNTTWVKPAGGLWTSPVPSDHDWFAWCTCEEFRLPALESRFDLAFSGEVAVIDCRDDLMALPYLQSDGRPIPDFEAIVAQGYDAIWLTVEGEIATRFSEPRSLYGWDCETVLVMNKDSVEQLTKEATPCTAKESTEQ